MKKIIILLQIITLQFSIYAQVKSNQVPTASTAGTLTIQATTRTAGGQYGPNGENCIAVWVQNSSNQWVKTLLLSAQLRRPDLTVWRAITSNSNNIVDAIAGATRTSFSPINCTWNGTNAANPRVVVEDGVYTVKLEMADDQPANFPVGHKVVTYTFTKGTANSTATLVGSAENSFSNVNIQWVPNSTSINDIDIEKQYSVYPNPTKSSVYISGFDVKRIEICSLSGKTIFSTYDQKLNISSLPIGIYFAKIITSKGTVIKKIQKI